MKFTRIEELERNNIAYEDDILIGGILHSVRYQFLHNYNSSNCTIFTELGMFNKRLLLAQVIYDYWVEDGEFPFANRGDFSALKRMAIFLMKSVMIKEDMGDTSWAGLMGAYRSDIEGGKNLIANIEYRYDVLIEKLSSKKPTKKQSPGLPSNRIINGIDDLEDYTLRNGDSVIILSDTFEVLEGKRLKSVSGGYNHITFQKLNINERTIHKSIYGYAGTNYSQWPYSKEGDFEGLTNMIRFLYKAAFLSTYPGNKDAFRRYVTNYRSFPELLVNGIKSHYERLTSKGEQPMEITHINQLDSYTLKIGDKIRFTSDISYKFTSSSSLSRLTGEDIYKHLGKEIKECSSHLSYWNIDGNINDSFGAVGDFPNNGTNNINPEQLTRTTRNIFKILALKNTSPKVLDEMTSNLKATDVSTKVFLKNLEEEYNKIKFTQVITNNNLKTKANGQIIIVPAKVATVNRGQNITGHAISGRRRQSTITVGHLSFYKIIGAG